MTIRRIFQTGPTTFAAERIGGEWFVVARWYEVTRTGDEDEFSTRMIGPTSKRDAMAAAQQMTEAANAMVGANAPP